MIFIYIIYGEYLVNNGESMPGLQGADPGRRSRPCAKKQPLLSDVTVMGEVLG